MKNSLFLYKRSIQIGSFILLFIISLIAIIAIALLSKSSFNNFFTLNKDEIYIIKFSIYQALLSTLFSLIIATIFALLLSYQKRFFARGLIISLISSSLVMPTIVISFGLIDIYGQRGFLKSIGIDIGEFYGLKGIVIAHVYLNSAYATKVLLSNLESIPLQKYKVATSLGFGAVKRFWYIEFIAIREALSSLFVTIFLLCFSSFAIILLLGGSPKYNTLEVSIYEAIRLDFDIPKALKYASIQISIASFITIFFSKRGALLSNISANSYDLSFLKSKTLNFFHLLIIAIFSIFFISVLISIFVSGFHADFKKILSDPLFLKALYISIFVATISALFSIFFVYAISDLKRAFTLDLRAKEMRFSKLFEFIISLFSNIYLVVSSLILGLGFFIISVWSDLNQTLMGYLALIISNILLTLPFGLSILYPKLLLSAKRYDKLALSLGLSYSQYLRYIDLRIIKKDLIYIFTLSFCFSLGDLGVISLFGSKDFTTLPWYLYSLLGSYQNSDANGVALILLLLTMLIFFTGERFAKDR